MLICFCRSIYQRFLLKIHKVNTTHLKNKPYKDFFLKNFESNYIFNFTYYDISTSMHLLPTMNKQMNEVYGILFLIYILKLNSVIKLTQ